MGTKDPANLQQYSSLRVFVYRLDIQNTIDIPGYGEIGIQELLSMDFADARYGAISEAFETSDAFKQTLSKIYANLIVQLGLGAGNGAFGIPKLFSGESIFKQIDITPLVANVNTAIRLDPPNSCTITIYDPQYSDVGKMNIQTYFANQSMKSKSSMAKSPGLFTNGQIEELNRFSFQEFDFVRVYAYSDSESSASDKMSRVADSIGSFGGIGDGLAFYPMFTGVVVSPSRRASASSFPTMTAECCGVYRALMQTVTVFNKALADIISKADTGIRFLAKDVNVTANTMQGKHAAEVFSGMINDYFQPKGVLISDPGGPRTALYRPTINIDDWNKILFKSDEDGNRVPVLVPFLPMLLLYHILKTMNSEPIAMFDDMLCAWDVVTPPRMGSNLMDGLGVDIDASKMIGFMDPYLLMIRENYQLFDSAYMSPADIFSEIRSKTFFEIFEDRTGAFHFRFPRYNSGWIRHETAEKSTADATFTKDDSGIYNATVVMPVGTAIGGIAGVPGTVHIDRLSIMKFGMRMPQIETNPNSKSSGFIIRLAKFMRGYYAARDSRTGAVRQLTDPTVNVGELFLFRLGRLGGQDASGSGSAQSSSPAPEQLLVGYVTEVAETFSPGSGFTQTIRMSFVRPSSPASGEVLKAVGLAKQDKILLSLPDAMAWIGSSSSPSDPGVNNAAKNIVTRTLLHPDGQADAVSDWMVPVPVSLLAKRIGNSKYIDDPIYLARESAKFINDNNKHTGAELSKEASAGEIEEMKRASMRSLQEQANQRGVSSANVAFLHECFQKLKEKTSAASKSNPEIWKPRDIPGVNRAYLQFCGYWAAAYRDAQADMGSTATEVALYNQRIVSQKPSFAGTYKTPESIVGYLANWASSGYTSGQFLIRFGDTFQGTGRDMSSARDGEIVAIAGILMPMLLGGMLDKAISATDKSKWYNDSELMSILKAIDEKKASAPR